MVLGRHYFLVDLSILLFPSSVANEKGVEKETRRWGVDIIVPKSQRYWTGSSNWKSVGYFIISSSFESWKWLFLDKTLTRWPHCYGPTTKESLRGLLSFSWFKFISKIKDMKLIFFLKKRLSHLLWMILNSIWLKPSFRFLSAFYRFRRYLNRRNFLLVKYRINTCQKF